MTLTLILPATVEKAFSTMNIVKIRLQNQMGDQWMNDNLVVYKEKDIFSNINNKIIMNQLQTMKSRRGQL